MLRINSKLYSYTVLVNCDWENSANEDDSTVLPADILRHLQSLKTPCSFLASLSPKKLQEQTVHLELDPRMATDSVHVQPRIPKHCLQESWGRWWRGRGTRWRVWGKGKRLRTGCLWSESLPLQWVWLHSVKRQSGRGASGAAMSWMWRSKWRGGLKGRGRKCLG